MVFVSRFGVSLPSFLLSLSSHPSSHNHYFHLCPTPPPPPPSSSPSTTSSSLWCFARCVHTAGWRWMMPFATSSWTSPVFHPGWLGRMTSFRQLSTKLSPPKRSITRAKVLYQHKQDTDIKVVFIRVIVSILSVCLDSNILFKMLYFKCYLVWHICVMAFSFVTCLM